MSIIKKWSTGKLGNNFPDHSDRGNPNTKGLTNSGNVGIEGYIEEDRVVASEDNRPLKNLTQNDIVLENNLSDVASELDYGILKGRYNEFELEILDPEIVTNPDDESSNIEITPLRIHSGSSFVNGSVIRTGNQKIVYFLKDDGSYLFPDYVQYAGKSVVEITDKDYFGGYKPVYDTETSDLSEDFTEYEIKITNVDSLGQREDRNLYYKVYRDWEDVIPFPPEEKQATQIVDFNYDTNYGQNSEGVWLNPDEQINIKTGDIEMKKDIKVSDKYFDPSSFKLNPETGRYEQILITDSVFFDNISWESGDTPEDVKDLYVDESDNIFFIYDPDKQNVVEYNLYKIATQSDQFDRFLISNDLDEKPKRLIKIDDILFIIGDNGLIKFFNNETQLSFNKFSNINTTETIEDVVKWDGQLWIATETRLFYTDYTSFSELANNPPAGGQLETTFNEKNIETSIASIAGSSVLNRIQGIYPISGNYVIDSSLTDQINNILENPSFEDGGINNPPVGWNVESISGNSTFTITNNDVMFGGMKGVLNGTVNDNEPAFYQDVYYEYREGEDWTFSIYLKSTSSSTINLTISEHDSTGVELTSTSTSYSLNGNNTWQRFSSTHNLENTPSYLRVKVSNTISTTPIQVDGAQLEIGNVVNQFVYGFDYLFIAFEKKDDVTNPPYAIIDKRRRYDVQYQPNIHGYINNINDLLDKKHNEAFIISDDSLYNVKFLNSIDSYDRIDIEETTSSIFDSGFKDRIDKLKTIEELDGKYYLGGSILNKNISFTLDDGENHSIELIGPEQEKINEGYSNFLDLIGPYRIVQATESSSLRVEFERTEELIESRLATINEGSYIPNKDFRFGIIVDGDDPLNTKVYYFNVGPSPDTNNSPWTVESVKNSITPDQNNPISESYNIEFNFETSTTMIDGLYSFGRGSFEKLLRGNIQKIFKPKNTRQKEYKNHNLYIARDNTILKAKYDPNIKKIDGEYPESNASNLIGELDSTDQLPASANDGDVYYVIGWGYFKWSSLREQWEDTNYFYRWKIYNDDYRLVQYCKVANRQLTFNDTTHNQYYVPVPLDSGYELVDGSLRLKVNDEVEYGWVSGSDYFVDEQRVIRNDSDNFLSDPQFLFIDQPSTQWSVYSDGLDYEFRKTTIDCESCAETFTYNDTTFVNINQIFTPSVVAPGDTYTFSLYIRSDVSLAPILRISECVSGSGQASPTEFASFDYATRSTEYTTTLGGVLEGWRRLEVTHTITESDSDVLRVELVVENDYQTKIKDAQLELNPYATPFVLESFTRIDPNATVYCDFVQSKVLTPGVDYLFNEWDSELEEGNRKIELTFQPGEDDELYFDYKYEKVFNPYRFGNSIPKIDVSYDSRDDYFLYEISGRIWAIDPILALLSFDEVNPITVDYNYYLPRIDKIKIRNKPDQFGNFLYIVKGQSDVYNPYSPNEGGYEIDTHIQGRYGLSIDEVDADNNEALYDINVTDYDFDRNDIYDRRIFIDSKASPYHNISLRDQTLAYIPFVRDFMSTDGLQPINEITQSRIVSIIKNYEITQNEEVGAWSTDYNISLRYKDEYPERISPSLSTFVDVVNGNDSNDGQYDTTAFKTIKKALDSVKYEGAEPNIVIISTSTVYEDVEIDLDKEVLIRAKTHFTWQGNIQNKSKVKFQGIEFKNFNHYVLNEMRFYHCDFVDSVINNYFPIDVRFYNCRIEDVNNTFVNINNSIFPSPFAHPYMKSASRDDGVEGSPQSVATSDSEAIYPNETGYNYQLTANPSGDYYFFHCLINRVSDSIVNYNIDNDDWRSSFTFERSTIVNGSSLFETKNIGQTILFNECIIWNNKMTISGHDYYFNSRSNIELLNCYIDFSYDSDVVPSSALNYDSRGNILGRRTCSFSGPNTEPGFVETQREGENYHLKSIAKGYLKNSVNIDRAADGSDIGCYDEVRERTDVDIPRKFQSNFAYIAESIQYPIVVNSEKVTFTIEFKPISQYNESGILFDTRSSEYDTDYIVVSYNNNAGEYATDIYPNENTSITNPYTFKIVVANAISKFVVISPIEINSDSQYQEWHKLSFTVNYEKVFNQKPSFDEKDKYQNVITFYHNEQLAVESFINYDLNRDTKGELLERDVQNSEFYEYLGNDIITNAWNYNDISDFITIGGDFSGSMNLTGYYSEMRIDNRFVDRKELAAWNNKILPFIDPSNYSDDSLFAKTFESEHLNEFWSLRSRYDIGAKGSRFEPKTQKRFDISSSELVWALTSPTENLIANADFSSNPMPKVVADVPPRLNSNISNRMFINTTSSRQSTDNDGVVIRFYDQPEQATEGMNFYSPKQLLDHLNDELFRKESGQFVNGETYIRFRYNSERKLEIYSEDWTVESITVKWENSGDPLEMGFDNFDPWIHNETVTEYNINVVFVDTMRADQYTPDGTPAWPYTSFEQASENITTGQVIKMVSGETLPGGGSTYEDFDITLNEDVITLEGSQVVKTKNSSITVDGLESGSIGGHEVWPIFDPYYSRFSHTSLAIKKHNYYDSTPIDVWFNKKPHEGGEVTLLEGKPYIITFYIYSIKPLTDDDISLIVDKGSGVEEFEFDSYETIFGYWRRVEKQITFLPGELNSDFGLRTKRDAEFYINGVQLEQSEFASPFTPNKNDNEGVIEVDKSLLSKERGIVFFKFKPMIDWNYDREIVLLEAIKYEKDDEGQLIYEDESGQPANYPRLDTDHGFRVTYYHDQYINKGVLTIKSNSITTGNDDSTERFYIVEPLWKKWHTLAIHYDHLTQRFIYFFDHYKRVVDSSAVMREWGSNLYIGRDVPKIYDQDQNEFEWAITGMGENENNPSANIYIKDLIITNYPVSTVEVEKWQNTKEFYKESLFTNLLDVYQTEMERKINEIEAYATDSGNLITQLDEFEDRIANFENTLNNSLDTIVHENEVAIADHETRITNNEDQLSSHEVSINSLTPTQQQHTTLLEEHRGISLAQPLESSISNNYSLIVDETNNRIDSIDALKGKLSLYPGNNTNDGAAFIGVHDSAANFSADNVEDVLAEIYNGPNSPTVVSNSDLIGVNTNNIASLQEDFAHIADGETGSWDRTKAKNNRWNVADIRVDVNTNTTNIANNESAIIAEESARQAADQQIITDLASASGAGMVGVEDAQGLYSAENVEGVLEEITGLGRTVQTIKSNYDAIVSNDSDISALQSDISSINTSLEEIGKVKDGSDGSTWSVSMNLKSHDDRLTTNEGAITTNESAITTNATDISNTLSYAQSVQANLTQEINDRQSADSEILNDLASTASGNGASMIGVSGSTFTGANIQDVLVELKGDIQTLENNLNWKYAVATQSDLPMTDNEVGDARTVLDDGDGFAAQYVWNGSEWVKIADINWGSAVDISFDPSGTKLESTSVQSAITEVYERSKDPTKTEDSVEQTAWSSGSEGYFYDIEHDLGTEDVTILPISKTDGRIVGVDRVESISADTARAWTTDDSEGLDFIIFGGMNSYSKVVGTWTADSGSYYHILEHNLNTSKLMVSVFDIYSGHRVNLDEVIFADDNTINLWSTTNALDINVFVLKRASDTKIKDIENWKIVSGEYIAEVKMPEDYDAIFSFIDPSSGAVVEVDDLWFEGGFLKIKSSDNSRLRMIILK